MSDTRLDFKQFSTPLSFDKVQEIIHKLGLAKPTIQLDSFITKGLK